MSKSRTGTPVSKAFQVQLARLFGSESKEAREDLRTPREWKRILRRVLLEIDRYIVANVDTDELHHMILASGLYAADQALTDETEIGGRTDY